MTPREESARADRATAVGEAAAAGAVEYGGEAPSGSEAQSDDGEARWVGADHSVGEAQSGIDPTTPAAVPVLPWWHGLRPVAGETAAAGRLAVTLLVAGIPVGVLWWLLAPRRTYEVSEDGAFAIVPDSEAAVGTDGWFMLLTGVLALAVAAVAWRRQVQRGPLIVVALAVGMLLCGLLAWQVGALLGPPPSAAALEKIGATVLGPLELRAYGALVVGPFLAVAGYVLAVCFTSRDDLRSVG